MKRSELRKETALYKNNFIIIIIIYSCLLDASKAFDRINHGKLFRLLLQRGIPPLIVRFFKLIATVTSRYRCPMMEQAQIGVIWLSERG